MRTKFSAKSVSAGVLLSLSSISAISAPLARAEDVSAPADVEVIPALPDDSLPPVEPAVGSEAPPIEASSPSSVKDTSAPPSENPREASNAEVPIPTEGAQVVAQAPHDGELEEDYPAYQRARPQFGFQFTLSAHALGGKDITPAQQQVPARGISIQFEYQPTVIQEHGLGVLGVGPIANFYPVRQDPLSSSGTVVTPSNLSLWDLGGTLRYQGRFFREQPLVPVFSYTVSRLSYKFSDGTNGKVTIKGPTFGIAFLLNILARKEAALFYQELGVSRSYLLAEWRNLSGDAPGVSVSGTSLFFGFRIER